MDVTTIIISSVAAVIVAYNTARSTSYSKDVIEERRKWRARVRCIAIAAARKIRDGETGDQAYQDLCSEFKVRLNT